jgi:hypothetical protein
MDAALTLFTMTILRIAVPVFLTLAIGTVVTRRSKRAA